MKLPTHPVSEKSAAAFHGILAALYLVALGFHAYAAWNHWKDRL